jgi:hypothetical protein
MKAFNPAKPASIAFLLAILMNPYRVVAASPADNPMSYDAQMKAADEARRKDPAWRPALPEIGQIQIGRASKPGSVHNYCLNTDGNILACCGGKFARVVDEQSGKTENASEAAEIRVLSPAGKLVANWPVDAMPQAICVDKSGAIFVAGGGRIARLDQNGKMLASTALPSANEPVVLGQDVEEMLKQMNRLNDAERKKMKEQLERRRADVTGIAVTDQDVFVCCPAPSDFSFRVYRFNHDLKAPKLILEKLRGCCGQMDIQAADGNLWVPHNARHRVECHDRDGKELAKFGKAGRVNPQDFGGCCEPKNLRFTRAGEILAAESGPPTCIKRFSKDGKFLGLVALAGASKGDCVRVTVEVSPDGKRYYLLDTTKDLIRVFGSKS